MMGPGTQHAKARKSAGVAPCMPMVPCEARTVALGAFHTLPDKRILDVLSFLGPADLVALGQCSSAMYVFAHHDKLWRPLVFRRFRGAFRFKRSWRLTCLLAADREVGDDYPKPLVFPRFPSELLYRHHYRAYVDRASFDISFSHIEKKDAPTYADFEEGYLKIGRPVILKGLCKEWTAMQWTPDYLVEHFGDIQFRLNWGAWNEEKAKYKRIYMTMRDFWFYARQHHDVEPGYIFDGAFWDRAPQMLDGFNRTTFFREDLFAVLGEHRPDFRWFLAGPAGSGSPWHIDPHATSAWNALLHGRKRWGLYPPSMPPPGINYVEGKNSISYSAPNAFRWYIEVYPTLKPEERPLELIQEPGEIIFVPAGWWHTVLNVTDTVAVTQNWLDRFNFNVGWSDLLRDGGTMMHEFYERMRYVRPELFAAYELEKKAALDAHNAKFAPDAKSEPATPTAVTPAPVHDKGDTAKKAVTFREPVADPDIAASGKAGIKAAKDKKGKKGKKGKGGKKKHSKK